MKKFLFVSGSVAFFLWLASGKKSDVDVEVITPRQLPTDGIPVRPLPGSNLNNVSETRDGATQLPTNNNNGLNPIF